MENTKTIEPLLNAQEVRRLLRCSLPWIYKAADRGLIPCVRIPCPGEGNQRERTMVRFKKEDVFNFIQNHYQR